jgi:hypothetical protein
VTSSPEPAEGELNIQVLTSPYKPSEVPSGICLLKGQMSSVICLNICYQS